MKKHLNILTFPVGQKTEVADFFTRFGRTFLESCRGLSACFRGVVAEFSGSCRGVFGELSGSFWGAVGEFSVRLSFLEMKGNHLQKPGDHLQKIVGSARTICKSWASAVPVIVEWLSGSRRGILLEVVWTQSRAEAAFCSFAKMIQIQTAEYPPAFLMHWTRQRWDEIGRRDRRWFIIFHKHISLCLLLLLLQNWLGSCSLK